MTSQVVQPGRPGGSLAGSGGRWSLWVASVRPCLRSSEAQSILRPFLAGWLASHAWLGPCLPWPGPTPRHQPIFPSGTSSTPKALANSSACADPAAWKHYRLGGERSKSSRVVFPSGGRRPWPGEVRRRVSTHQELRSEQCACGNLPG